MCLVHGKITWNGAGSCFSTNPDLADILGGMDVDFENCQFSRFQISKSRFLDFQKSGLGQAWAGPRLCAGLGPGRAWALGWVGPPVGLLKSPCCYETQRKLTQRGRVAAAAERVHREKLFTAASEVLSTRARGLSWFLFFHAGVLLRVKNTWQTAFK